MNLFSQFELVCFIKTSSLALLNTTVRKRNVHSWHWTRGGGESVVNPNKRALGLSEEVGAPGENPR